MIIIKSTDQIYIEDKWFKLNGDMIINNDDEVDDDYIKMINYIYLIFFF